MLSRYSQTPGGFTRAQRSTFPCDPFSYYYRQSLIPSHRPCFFPSSLIGPWLTQNFPDRQQLLRESRAIVRQHRGVEKCWIGFDAAIQTESIVDMFESLSVACLPASGKHDGVCLASRLRDVWMSHIVEQLESQVCASEGYQCWYTWWYSLHVESGYVPVRSLDLSL
jgi:hypothetical protein